METPPPQPPPAILAHYAPALDGLRWVPAGGGFSGAVVFRGDDSSGAPVFSLKGWPAAIPPSRVSQVHGWVKQAAHLPFVPAVLPNTSGESFALGSGRVWEVARWMPGSPLVTPTVGEIEAGCAAVARLHAAWPVERHGPCPGVLARLRAFADFRTYFANCPAPAHLSHQLNAILRRARAAVTAAAPWAERALRRWDVLPLPLRPCVRDLRGEHILFTDRTVTGIIDYGAMALDNPATDLARLLGDLAADDDAAFAAGLRAYRDAGGQLDVPDAFVRLLDRAGAIGSLVGWHVRLMAGQNVPEGEARIADRMGHLLARVERFGPA